MTDFIAYTENNKPISVYDNINEKLFCACGGEVIKVKESIPFYKKKCENLIQKRPHYRHKDGCICSIKKIEKEIEDDIEKDDMDFLKKKYEGQVLTELEKNEKSLILMIIKVKDSYKKFEKYKEEIKIKKQEAYKYGIDANKYMSDIIKTILYGVYISIDFNDLDFLNIESNKNYRIGNICSISQSRIHNIIIDKNRYETYMTKLSIISIYYSRCLMFKKYKEEIDFFKIFIEKEKKKQKLFIEENDV